MKFGKKRSPEPDPIDITERLSILDLRPSVRDGSATPISEGIGAPQVVRPPAAASVAVAETPAAETVESAAPAAPPVVAAPVVPEPVVETVNAEAAAPEPVHAEPAAPAYVEAAHPAPAAAPSGLGAPDPLAYEMAAFELNLPPAAAAALAQPVPSEPVNLPEPEQHHEAEPEPAVAAAPEPAAPEPVEAPQPPAWSYEQVARIEHAEQHVSAWVPPQAQPQPEHVAQQAAPQAEEPAIDLTEPADEPAVDLVEHDPVYAAVEASQNQSRDDEGVIRWHW